jgi:hypothetical protein
VTDGLIYSGVIVSHTHRAADIDDFFTFCRLFSAAMSSRPSTPVLIAVDAAVAVVGLLVVALVMGFVP